jgi:hypothetical protein
MTTDQIDYNILRGQIGPGRLPSVNKADKDYKSSTRAIPAFRLVIWQEEQIRTIIRSSMCHQYSRQDLKVQHKSYPSLACW